MAATRLDPDSILRAALALADEKGFAALSMRALADRLGVKAASLYYHVPSREALTSEARKTALLVLMAD